LQLLLGVQRDAGRLLAVAQRRIKDQYSVWIRPRHNTPWNLELASSRLVSRLHAAAGALFPPKGEEKKSKVEAERHARQAYQYGQPAPRVQRAAPTRSKHR